AARDLRLRATFDESEPEKLSLRRGDGGIDESTQHVARLEVRLRSDRRLGRVLRDVAAGLAQMLERFEAGDLPQPRKHRPSGELRAKGGVAQQLDEYLVDHRLGLGGAHPATHLAEQSRSVCRVNTADLSLAPFMKGTELDVQIAARVGKAHRRFR